MVKYVRARFFEKGASPLLSSPLLSSPLLLRGEERRGEETRGVVESALACLAYDLFRKLLRGLWLWLQLQLKL
jgi:hypothetical protein